MVADGISTCLWKWFWLISTSHQSTNTSNCFLLQLVHLFSCSRKYHINGYTRFRVLCFVVAILSCRLSSYRKFHSTETALTRVHDDILRAIDDNKSVLLTMLDLSAAFDSVGHAVLLERLKSGLGICVTALNWFKPYLSGISQSVLINGTQSKPTSLVCSVPQGSVLGPIHYLHAAFRWHNQEAWNAVSHVCGWLSIIHHFRSIWHQSDSFKYGNFDRWHPWLVLR